MSTRRTSPREPSAATRRLNPGADRGEAGATRPCRVTPSEHVDLERCPATLLGAPEAGRPDAARARDRAARRRRGEQPRDRGPAGDFRAHRRQPPAARVPQARRHAAPGVVARAQRSSIVTVTASPASILAPPRGGLERQQVGGRLGSANREVVHDVAPSVARTGTDPNARAVSAERALSSSATSGGSVTKCQPASPGYSQPRRAPRPSSRFPRRAAQDASTARLIAWPKSGAPLRAARSASGATSVPTPRPSSTL